MLFGKSRKIIAFAECFDEMPQTVMQILKFLYKYMLTEYLLTG